jgi:hypothetical protein
LFEKEAHPLAAVLATRLEASAVRPASALIVNTPPVERAMRARYPSTRVTTILNGVDEVFAASRGPDDPFRIVYAGTIYLDRDPRVLFEAVGKLVRAEGIDPRQLQVEFIGHASHYHGVPTKQLARDAGISEHFHLEPPMQRGRLLERLAGASLLVSLPQSTPWSTPSKLFEYMGFDAWMLVYAAAGSATAEILSGSNAIVLEPADVSGTLAALRRCYDRHRCGLVPSGNSDRERFARARRGEELLRLLAEVGWRAPEAGMGATGWHQERGAV